MKRKFKAIIFLMGCILGCLNTSVFAARLVGDFDNDGKITTNDVMFMLAKSQLANETSITVIQNQAKFLLPSVSTTLQTMPDTTLDDLTGDGKLTTDDVLYELSYAQLQKFDSSVLESQAKFLLNSVSGSVQKFPGIEIGGASISVSIDNISTSP